MRILASSLFCFLLLLTSQAEARHYKHQSHRHHYTRTATHQQKPSNEFFFNWFASGQQQVKEARARKVYAHAPSHRADERSYSSPATMRSTPVNETRIVYSHRPSDCYGIAWCGCWLKHYLGVANSRLNLNRAIEWAYLGSPSSAHTGTVVVWRHHVGIMKSDPDSRGYAIVLSGNSGGRTGITEVRRRINNAVAFRSI